MAYQQQKKHILQKRSWIKKNQLNKIKILKQELTEKILKKKIKEIIKL